MKHFRVLAPLIFALALPAFFLKAEQKAAEDGPRPLKALLIAGGCCHDYVKQHEILYKGIQERANVRVDVVWTRDRSTNPPLPIYKNPDWAKGYDIIIHDECAASNKDPEVLKNILEAHKTVPAVHLHCAMHSFRQGNDLWFKHLGLQSSGHGPQEPVSIQFTDPESPDHERPRRLGHQEGGALQQRQRLRRPPAGPRPSNLQTRGQGRFQLGHRGVDQ